MAGTLFVVGLGPGREDLLTGEARSALLTSDLICGYTTYLRLIPELISGKETYTTPMRGEMERCRHALEQAAAGRTVSLICSGDPGVYGMASPVLTLSPEYPDVEIVVVPGVTAALSGAAVLGAPLGNDFCVISLSDLLTPWETIARRLKAAALGDFSTVLYNPASKKRRDHLERACQILLENGKSPVTCCGWVRNIGREGQEHGLCTLEELKDLEADMFTTVFIGSSDTENIGGHLVTPRGYRNEENRRIQRDHRGEKTGL
ncbi:MAG: precorrin-3B C(17)-methyltransferase [Acutalibacteraceae bacterium]|nr:precorrin-3B C(17)-methyltransferase [Acutalibacteraceae bacterium]